jgi:hypothetical protein
MSGGIACATATECDVGGDAGGSAFGAGAPSRASTEAQSRVAVLAAPLSNGQCGQGAGHSGAACASAMFPWWWCSASAAAGACPECAGVRVADMATHAPALRADASIAGNDASRIARRQRRNLVIHWWERGVMTAS